MAQMADFFFTDVIEYETTARSKFLTPQTKPILERFLRDFRALGATNEAGQKSMVEAIATEQGKKLVDIIQPIRVALSGKTVSPGIFEVIGILGRDVVEKRIERAIASIS